MEISAETAIISKLEKINELLKLILAALEKSLLSRNTNNNRPDVQSLVLTELQTRGGGTIAEIAKRANIPENTVKSALYRLWDKNEAVLEKSKRSGTRQAVSYFRAAK